ncbi:MAG: hypothetical protein V1772_03700, partial [Chloroflexota bacterium]
MALSHRGPKPVRAMMSVPTLLLVFALLTSWVGAAAPAADPSLAVTLPRIYFSPSPVEVGLGLTNEVKVMIQGISGMHGAQVRIAFPKSIVRVKDAYPAEPGTQVKHGDMFVPANTYIIKNDADNSAGRVEYILSLIRKNVVVNGSGILLTIPLEPVATGTGVLSFVEVILCEPDGTTIKVQIDSGQVTVNVVAATSTPTFTPAPTSTTDPAQSVTPSVTPSSSPEPAVRVRAAPVSQQTPVGGNGVLQVRVDNVCDLFAYDVRLDYNGSPLDVEDGSPGEPGIQVYMGDVFDGLPHQVVQNGVYDDGVFGQVQFVASLNTLVPTGFCGSGVLLWVMFRGMVPGYSNVTLTEVNLYDHAGDPIARGLTHGEILVGIGPFPSLTPSSTPSKTSTPTASSTATQTPANTATYTPGPSPTATQTPTNTATYTPGPSPTPTQTLTPTKTNTPTPTSGLLTPTPVCRDLIVNGGFETVSGASAPPWVTSGGTSYTTIEKHSGSRSAWLGGSNNALDSLYQTVTIPAHPNPGESLTEATLKFWWGVLTDEVAHPFD